MTQKMTNFNFRVPQSLRDDFKRKAQRNGKTATALLNQWIKDHCNDSNDRNDDEEDSPYRKSNDSNDKLSELEEKLSQLSAQVDALQNSNDSNDTEMTTALEARLSEVLEGVSCPFNFGNDDINESAIAPKGSYDPIADSLPSIVSGDKLTKAYYISPSTLRGLLKNPPQPGVSKLGIRFKAIGILEATRSGTSVIAPQFFDLYGNLEQVKQVELFNLLVLFGQLEK